jgi:hypothetical protein
MKIQIKSIFENLLFEGDFENISKAVCTALKNGADLRDANLRGATLRGADLRGAKGIELAISKTRILPDGDIIGWKKCQGGVLVKLLSPADAKRSSAFGRKCRAEKVKVLEVIGAKEGVSTFTDEVKYHVGDVVKPQGPFCDDWMQECASGIHFFITRIEAENYEA